MNANTLNIILGLALSGYVGIMFTAPMLVAYAIVFILHLFISGAAGLTGGTEGVLLTPGDIFTNKVAITNIDFFNFDAEHSLINTVRNTIAQWFVILNSIALLLLLFVLVYIAIRILISSAEGKAKYKEALESWGISVALLFVLQIYSVFLIRISGFFVEVISKSIMDSNVITEIFRFENMLKGALINFIPSLIIYGMFVRYTFIFFIQYIRRMFKIGFLIMISPLISVTYAIDKFADKKAQSLTKWMSEFSAEVLIQPFHALIYLMMLSMSKTLVQEGGLIAGLVGIVSFKFISEAEGLIKQIFSVRQASSLSEGDKIASSIIHSKMVSKLADKANDMKIFQHQSFQKTFGVFGNQAPNVRDGVGGDSSNGPASQFLDLVRDVDNANNYQNDSSSPNVDSSVDQDSSGEDTSINTATDGNVDDSSNASHSGSQDEQQEKAEREKREREEKAKREKEEKKKDKENKNKKDDKKKKSLLEKRRENQTKFAFGFALAGAAFEAADMSDPLLKNLYEGATFAHPFGRMFEKVHYNAKQKGELKRSQSQMYGQNVKMTSNELRKNWEVFAALNQIDPNEITKESGKLFLQWMQQIESQDVNSLSSVYEANKNRLIEMYSQRENISEIEAANRVEDLQEEVLALGDNINIYDYNENEKEFLNSMINLKTSYERMQIETNSDLVNEDVYSEVKALAISEFNENNDIEKIKETKIKSEFMTLDDKKQKLEENYLTRIRSKDKEVDDKLTKYEELTEKYNEKYNLDEKELDRELRKAGNDLDEFKLNHDSMLMEIKILNNELKDKFTYDYGIDGEKFEFEKPQSANAIAYIKGKYQGGWSKN